METVRLSDSRELLRILSTLLRHERCTHGRWEKPRNMSSSHDHACKEMEFDRQIDQALKLKESGKLKECFAILNSFADEIPNTSVETLRIVGALFLSGKDFGNARSCFLKAVETDPRSPDASLGLFHALWGLGQQTEAFSELRRFLSTSTSEEHFRLIEEMRDGLMDRDQTRPM